MNNCHLLESSKKTFDSSNNNINVCSYLSKNKSILSLTFIESKNHYNSYELTFNLGHFSLHIIN